MLEHKTYSYRPKIDVLQQAFQFVAYEWALSQLDIGDVEGTAYDGIWSRATPPRGSTFDDLFTRMQITHTPTHLADVEATIRDCVTDMSNDPLIYPNRTWMGCTDCSAFERLCAAQSAGEDTTWMRQTQFVRLDVDREPVLED